MLLCTVGCIFCDNTRTVWLFFFYYIFSHWSQEACQIPGIGKRMADKIEEIMESGHLRKLDHIGEAVPVLELFTNIWGAGTKTAQLWYQQVKTYIFV